MDVSDLEASALLSAYGPATAEELAKHQLRPLGRIRPEDIRGPVSRTLGTPELVQRIDGVGLQTALLRLQLRGEAISVTLGRRKKERRTLWMTPQQGTDLIDGIRRALG